jgi:hypothetical protein
MFQEVLTGNATAEAFLDTWATGLEEQYVAYQAAKKAS